LKNYLKALRYDGYPGGILSTQNSPYSVNI